MDRYILKEKVKMHRNGKDKVHYIDIREKDTNVEIGSVFNGYEKDGMIDRVSRDIVMADIRAKIEQYESLVK